MQERIRRFWKGVALYVSHHGWPTKKLLGFRWSKKAKTTLETISIRISIRNFQHFQLFSIFIYNEILPVKYQFFKTCKCFDKEREKKLIQQSMRKEKLKKVGLCFITSYFIISFNTIIKGTLMQIWKSQSMFVLM